MPFQKGQPRPANAGRKKLPPGVVPKATVTELLASRNCDPILGMIDLAMDTTTKPELRYRCYAELAQYKYPKRRAIEISGPDGGPVEANVSIRELLLSRINSIASRASEG